MNRASPLSAQAELRDRGRHAIRPEEIQHLDRDALVALQKRVGLGETFGRIELPSDWFPPGHRTRTNRTVDFSSGLRSEHSVRGVERALLVATRYALVLYLVPTATRRERRFPAVTTYVGWLRAAKQLIELALLDPRAEEGLLVGLSRTSLDKLSPQARKRVCIEIARMQQLHGEGVWSDVPLSDARVVFERSRLEADSAVRAAEKENPHQPLEDAFVAEAGWRVCWLMDVLAPPLLDCARRVADLAKSEFESPSPQTRKVRRHKLVMKFLQGFEWHGADGEAIRHLPFKLRERANKHGSRPVWPPRSVGDIKHLLSLVQFAHMFVFLLSTGARISEALSVDPGSVGLIEANETAEGKTYKLVYGVGGAPKEWPLTDRGGRALVQQKLVKAALLNLPMSGTTGNRLPDAANGIWVQPRGGGDLERGYLAILTTSVQRLDIEVLLDGVITAHRFRKTLARLAALALVGAPKILMDLFGHRTIAMTLHYILADPQLRAEIQEVAKAQTIMMAEDAINGASTNGGPAAERIKGAVERERARHGSQFGAENVRQMAEMLTFSGQHWVLVREGVICTKTNAEAGPCSKRFGVPEPSRCRSLCAHRLERGLLRDDVDRTLATAVENLRRAEAEQDEILSEEWRGQILANIHRFPDLKTKWADVPRVAQLLSNGDL